MTATRTANKQQVYSVLISKTTTLHGIKLFCTFLRHYCVTAPWNFLISHARFMELVNTTQMFLFLFLNVDMVLLSPILPTFDKLNEIEWDQWSLKQCKSTFEVMFSVFCWPEIALPWQRDGNMARWCNDFSSLLSWELQLPWTCF